MRTRQSRHMAGLQLIDSKKEAAARAARRGGEAANAALAGADADNDEAPF